jgi:hypothetical protein
MTAESRNSGTKKKKPAIGMQRRCITRFRGNKLTCNNRGTFGSSVCSFSHHVTVLSVTETGSKNM